MARKDSKLAVDLWDVISSGSKKELLSLINSDNTGVTKLLNNDTNGPVLLCEACRLGHEEIVTLLTGYFKNLDCRTPQGSPLTIAAEQGFVQIVDTLLCNGAKLDKPKTKQKNYCPFYVSALYGWIEVLSRLIDHIPGLLTDISCQTLILEAACAGGYVGMVRFCVQKIMEVTQSGMNQHFLHFAVEKACKERHKEVIAYLGTIGAELTSSLVDTYYEVIGEMLFDYTSSVGHKERKANNEQDGGVKADWRSMKLSMVHPDWMSSLGSTLVHLDISDNCLSGLTDTIPWSLPKLEKLEGQKNRLRMLESPPDGMIRCQRLREINFSENALETLPIQMFQISSLEVLNLSNNMLHSLHKLSECGLVEDEASSSSVYFQTSTTSRLSRHKHRSSNRFLVSGDNDAIWSCFSLKVLDVSHNQLKCMSMGLRSCGLMNTLNMSHNKLSGLPQLWSCPMISLDVSHNEVTRLPCSIEESWATLEFLNISYNLISEIPQSVCRLSRLEQLDADNNQLRELPKGEWWECQLKKLFLSHNRLQNTEPQGQGSNNPGKLKEFLLKSVGTSNVTQQDCLQFPAKWSESLLELSLSHNNLTSVPLSVCHLKHLQTLDLSYNPGLNVLPPELCQLGACYAVHLNGLKIENIPREILADNNSAAVMAYLKQNLRKAVPYNKVKLMVVGKESKGKSTLVSVLQGLKMPPNVATNGVVISEWKVPKNEIKKKLESSAIDKYHATAKGMKPVNYRDVVFQIWDFAGQSDYYVTHKVFLSPSALYLLVYDLRLYKEGVDGLRTWLLDIKAHSPNSNVIIVGTFLDFLTPEGKQKLPEFQQLIHQKYRSENGFPRITAILNVSNQTEEGIEELKEVIYNIALHKKVRNLFFHSYTSPSVPLVGRLVPKSYMDMVDLIQKESKKRQVNKQWPVLSEDEFYMLVRSNPDNDINSKEELALATSFLHEAGVILHFSNQLRGLHFLYFIDPSWLAQILARFITLDASNRCVRNGILNLEDAQKLLFPEERHKSGAIAQYVELLEKFEIALLLDHCRLLIPSKLPSERPGLAMSLYRVSAERSVYRLYKMSHVPSGFWSRLITQILVMVTRLDSQGDSSKRSSKWAKYRQLYHTLSGDQGEAKVTYWQEGIMVDFGKQTFCVESCAQFFGELRTDIPAGLIIKVHSTTSSNYSLMGFAVDQVDSLLDQWYPGLEGNQGQGTQRLIPCSGCMAREETIKNMENIHMFSVHDCALALLRRQPIADKCSKCGQIDISLRKSIPDLLLLDVPDSLHVDLEDLQFDESGTVLGQGGEGTVYLGYLHKDTQVAIKQNSLMTYIKNLPEQKDNDSAFHTASDASGTSSQPNVESGDDKSSDSTEMWSRASTSSSTSLDSMSIGNDLYNAKMQINFRLMGALRSVRQEAVLMSQMTHPCIIALLGVNSPNLLHVLEFAPLGSLRSILNKKVSEKDPNPKELQPCLLGRTITYKIIYQVASGLAYLHSKSIVYKDLKADNILVWSLSAADVVNIKLSDYGLSRVFSQQGLRGYEGTVGYQAPEMRSGESYNEKVDIFALGMVIFETVTGCLPFHELSSLLIPHTIEDGKRPSFQHEGVEPSMPCLNAIMEGCWLANPALRLPAKEIVAQMRQLSFPCYTTRYSGKDSQLLSKVQCVCHTTPKSQQPLVRFWTDHQNGRSYNILNVDNGVFKKWNEGQMGSKVTCMTLADKVMIVGTEAPSIELLCSHQSTGELTPAGSSLSTGFTPLAMLARKLSLSTEQSSGYKWELFVTFCNGVLRVYWTVVCPGKSTSMVEKQSFDLALTGDQQDQACTCMSLLEGVQELWVGCGGDIVIVNVTEGRERYTLQDDRIRVFSGGFSERTDFQGNYLITAICHHGDQVWCLSRRGCNLVEIDTGTRQVLCTFDCLQEKCNIDTVLSDCSSESSKTYSWNYSAPTDRHTGSYKDEEDSQLKKHLTLRRKMSAFGKSSIRRSKGIKGDKRQLQCRVRSLCYVKGTLWVGRKCGDIIVLNVTSNNPYGYEYGQVLANLCNEHRLGYGNGSIGHMINVEDKHVVAFRTVYESHSQEERTEIVTWCPYGVDDINLIRRTWEDLDLKITSGHVKGNIALTHLPVAKCVSNPV